MKKLLVLVWIFIAILFSNFSFVEAAVVWSESNIEIPYCSWNECSLEEWINKARWEIKDIYNDQTKWASDYIQDIIVYLLWFLYFVAVVVIIYAWFNILTAAWDEEKVSKSKKIILFSIIWMVIIFLAWPIANFVLQVFEQAK